MLACFNCVALRDSTYHVVTTYLAQTVISIHRADYMMDYRKGVASEGPILTTKQTEVNPFAVGIIAHEPIQDFHE